MAVGALDPKEEIGFLRGLRTARRFRPEEIPDNVVQDILEVARWSGTASNRPHSELVLTRNRETLRALAGAEGYVGHLAGAALGIVLVMQGQADYAEQEIFDEGRLTERILLAAKAYGVGGSPGWLMGGGVDEAKRLLGIPGERRVRTVLSLGYPAEQPSAGGSPIPRGRKPLAEMVHMERY